MPNRIDFDPFPWQSFAVWIMTQMKRWGQIKGDVDYAKVAQEVFLATDTAKLMKEVGLTPPTATSKTFVVMGKTFDPAKPEEYIKSFKIKKARDDGAGPAHTPFEPGRQRCSLTWRAAIVSLTLFCVSSSRGIWPRAARLGRNRWIRNTPS